MRHPSRKNLSLSNSHRLMQTVLVFAERRLEDVAARQHFEDGVHGDLLLNPPAANPGRAAGRSGARSNRRHNGTWL